MDHPNFTTIDVKRKKGAHLTLDERGMIQGLHAKGCSLREIAAVLNCSPTTVSNELKRGTPERTGNRGRPPGYSAKRGQAIYEENRKRSKRHYRKDEPGVQSFIQWMCEQVRNHRMSPDACVGSAARKKLFPDIKIPCTKTLYNMIHKNLLPISPMDLREMVRRKTRKPRVIKYRRVLGKSIEERPEEVSQKTEIGHWEIDTVIGQRSGKEAVLFTAVEKVTRKYIVLKISGKTTVGVKEAMDSLVDLYGSRFSEVFKTITADNGSEFSSLSEYESTGTQIFFAHPYSSWERGQNERQNRILRSYIPKGKSIENYTDDQIAEIENEINQMPRKSLNYACSDDLFEAFLDQVYALKE